MEVIIIKSKEQDKDQTIFINYNSRQSEEIICRAPTKAQLILHEWISQNPLLWNYENHIHAYLKIKRNKKLFEDVKVLTWKEK